MWRDLVGPFADEFGEKIYVPARAWLLISAVPCPAAECPRGLAMFATAIADFAFSTGNVWDRPGAAGELADTVTGVVAGVCGLSRFGSGVRVR